MKFNLQIYHSSKLSQFGNCTDLDIDETIDELSYFLFIQEKYTQDELRTILTDMKLDYRIFNSIPSSDIFDVKITKTKL